MSIYLDYNASSPILPEVLDTMIDAYKNTPGNADSRTHIYGTNAQKLVNESRSSIASVLGIDPSELIFTSGSTESNNTVILGIQEYAEQTGKKHIVTTAIEHKAILEPLHYLESRGYKVDFIKPDTSGRVSAKDILEKASDQTCLVSVMFVNSETGIIQPVDEIGSELKKRNILFHVDAEEAPVEEVGGYAGGAASGEGWQSLHAEVSILCKRTKPIFSTMPVTRALPIKNALRMSDTPSV